MAKKITSFFNNREFLREKDNLNYINLISLTVLKLVFGGLDRIGEKRFLEREIVEEIIEIFLIVQREIVV